MSQTPGRSSPWRTSGSCCCFAGCTPASSIPQAVAVEIQDAVPLIPDWMPTVRGVSPEPFDRGTLDAGEFAALQLALAIKASLVLVDDYRARRRAVQLGLTITGTIGVVLRAKSEGMIPAAKPLLSALIECGLYVSPALFQEALRQAGE